jgi:hypothetical protein
VVTLPASVYRRHEVFSWQACAVMQRSSRQALGPGCHANHNHWRRGGDCMFLAERVVVHGLGEGREVRT